MSPLKSKDEILEQLYNLILDSDVSDAERNKFF